MTTYAQVYAFDYFKEAHDDPRYRTITTMDDLYRCANHLKAKKLVAADSETSGLEWYRNSHVVGMAYTAKDGDAYQSYYLPFGHLTGEAQLPKEPILALTKDICEDESIRKLWHNRKFDDHMLRREGIRLHGPNDDTMVAARLYDENTPAKLKTRALCDLGRSDAQVFQKMLDRETIRLAKRVGLKKKQYLRRFGFAQIPIHMAGLYGGRDTEYTHQLFEFYLSKNVYGYFNSSPRGPDALSLYEIETELTRILCDVEEAGLQIDVPYVEDLKVRASEERERVASRLWETVGAHRRFNLGSDDELRYYLQHTVGAPLWKRSRKTNEFAVDAEAIEDLIPTYPYLQLVLDWRDMNRIVTTYTDSILKRCDDRGVLHGDFQQLGTDCMPAGELVLTSRGYLPVEQVQVGDEVVTHKGRARPVTATVLNGVKAIYRVTLSNGLVLRTTGNHEYKTPQGGWARASDLKNGMAVEVHSGPERWQPVPSWPDFQVSSWGRVQNVKTGCILAQQPKGKWGHRKVCLHRNGAQVRGKDRKDYTVHRLVAKAFLKPLRGRPEVRHLNGIAWENVLEHLRFGTSKENSRDAVRHGTMSWRDGKQAKLTPEAVQEIRATPFVRAEKRLGRLGSDRTLAKQFGVSRELVRDVRRGHRWQEKAPVEDREFDIALVQSVEIESAEMTYGLTVEEDHSHVTGGVVTHNTGRMSCRDPNLQNIYGDSTARALAYSGQLIKHGGHDPFSLQRAFLIDPGFARLFVDYGQIELRVLAHFSQDPVMLAAYRNAEDIHERTALEVFGEHDDERRRMAKVINFGLSYCLSAQGLSRQAKIPLPEAEAHMGRFFQRYAGILALRKRVWAQARMNNGTIANMWGRLRTVPLLLSHDKYAAKRGERMMIGSLIQGQAAELTKESMVRIDRWVREKGYEDAVIMRGSIHDEIELDAHVEVLREAAEEIPKMMTNYPEFSIPIVVDTKYSITHWGAKTGLPKAA